MRPDLVLVDHLHHLVDLRLVTDQTALDVPMREEGFANPVGVYWTPNSMDNKADFLHINSAMLGTVQHESGIVAREPQY
jgi:hypothetical protein